MLYNIIKDEKELRDFIDFLPDLKDGEKFIVGFYGRNKYGATPGLKADGVQIKRFTATKKDLERRVRQLETKVGTYMANDIPLNEGSLVVYINFNPRNLHKAAGHLATEIVKRGFQNQTIYSADALNFDFIQTTPSRKIYFDVDIDFKPGKEFDVESLTHWLDGKINPEAVSTIVQTHGGYHIMVELSKVANEFKKNWVLNFRNGVNEYIDVNLKNSDGWTPMPGTTQGGFIPRLIK